MASFVFLTMSKLIFVALFIGFVENVEIDTSGYIVFCPCMGRFGNQVDQLLGTLQFSRSLNRTLVLPNFIEYEYPNTKMVSFESIFQVSTLRKYTKVITMTEFKQNVLKNVWPQSERRAFCWSPRQSIYDNSADVGCHAKEGSPFGPYWDAIGVDFVGDEYFGDIPGGYESTAIGNRKDWMIKFPPEKYPVIAFANAPATFPSKSKHWPIQKYLKWSTRIIEEAKKFINEKLTKPFVGVHLRNNKDWDNVCKHIDVEKNNVLFASAQCLGEANHLGTLTREMCAPSKAVIIEKIIEQVGLVGAQSVYVTSDNDHMIDEINDALSAYEIKAHRLDVENVHVSLAILARSDVFIGNCVSTFSHIVKRERDHGHSLQRPTVYFGQVNKKRRIEL